MKNGFTLVELSIVLVIIGLLSGGVLVASSMISTVKAQKIVNDLQQYEIASTNFQNLYKFHPGDSPAFDPPGNGDRLMGYGAGGLNNNCNGIKINVETQTVFAHLSQARMLKPAYRVLQPGICGGTDTKTYWELPGEVAPYTELDQKAVNATPGVEAKSVYSIEGTRPADLVLVFLVQTDYALALEAKLGNVALGQNGLWNATGFKGMCYGHMYNAYACGSSDAKYGMFYYQLPSLAGR